MKKCLYCKKEFINKKKSVKYCSKSCSVQDRYIEDVGLFRNEVPDHIKRYILGLFMTDGCLTKNGKKFVVVISLKDEYMIAKIRDLVCPTKKVYKDGNNFQVRWRNKRDIRVFNKLGIKQRKTLNMPFINLNKNKWSFIRGVFDGDGAVYISKAYDKKVDKVYEYKCVSFTCGSKKFAEGLNKFLNDNKIKSKIYKEKRSENILYVKILNIEGVKLLKEKMYAEEQEWLLTRKYNIF